MWHMSLVKMQRSWKHNSLLLCQNMHKEQGSLNAHMLQLLDLSKLQRVNSQNSGQNIYPMHCSNTTQLTMQAEVQINYIAP